MGRILGIDYGTKHIGIAVTDPSQVICTGLATLAKKEALAYILSYISKEKVELVVIGQPLHTDGRLGDVEQGILDFIQKIRLQLPNLVIQRIDERYTSQIALHAVHAMGFKKKQAKEKGMLDQISASLLLETYLERKKNGY